MWLFKNWYYLYSNQTEAERALEPAVAALGRRYRAQHLFPGLKHVADFALLDDRLIIEVDGKSHSEEGQIAKDFAHTLGLAKIGWRVFRCKNEEAVSDPEGTVAKALAFTHFPTLAELEEAVRQHPVPSGAGSRRRGRRRGKPPATAPRPARKAKAAPKAR